MKISDFNPRVNKTQAIVEDKNPIVFEEIEPLQVDASEDFEPIYGLEECDAPILKRWNKIAPESFKRLANWD